MSTPPKSIWNNGSLVAVCVVLTGSIGLNLVQAMSYRSATPAPTGIKVGMTIKRIPAIGADGKPQQVALDGAHWTVLYVMAPGCQWCARNLENIRTLASHSDAAFHFIGLSNTAKDLDRYLASTPLPFPVIAVDVEHAPNGLDVRSTPQMALVRPDGRVDKVWRGTLGGSNQTEVERFFHVKLPGWHEGKNAAE